MRFGISLVLGPIKVFLGTPCCRLDQSESLRPSRKSRAKSVETSRAATIAPAKLTARDTVASSTPAFQLDPHVRNDILALVTLGFPKRQAQSRVDAVTAGTTTEDIIKSALQGGR